MLSSGLDPACVGIPCCPGGRWPEEEWHLVAATPAGGYPGLSSPTSNSNTQDDQDGPSLHDAYPTTPPNSVYGDCSAISSLAVLGEAGPHAAATTTGDHPLRPASPSMASYVGAYSITPPAAGGMAPLQDWALFVPSHDGTPTAPAGDIPLPMGCPLLPFLFPPDHHDAAMESTHSTHASQEAMVDSGALRHSQAHAPKPPGTRFPCPHADCPAAPFKRAEHRKRHITTYHDNRDRFPCRFCSRMFNRRDNWRAHLRLHTLQRGRNVRADYHIEAVAAYSEDNRKVARRSRKHGSLAGQVAGSGSQS